MSEWISVKDRLPKSRFVVLAYEKPLNTINMSFYEKNSESWIDCDSGYYLNSVTHWMPLPEPPKEMYASPSRTPTPDRISHLAEILKTEYSDRTVTIDNFIYILRRLADIIAEDEPPKEEP